MAWIVAIIGSLAGFLFGYDEGIIAGSLGLIRDHFFLNEAHVGVMASALPFGALLGSMIIGGILASHFSKRFGRRSLLAFAGGLFFLGALSAAMAVNLIVLVSSRFVLGLAIGLASVTAPLYLAETAPGKIRGAIVAVYQLAITLGIVCAYFVNYLLIEQHAWRTMFASCAIPALMLFVGMFFLPESPRWLYRVGRKDDAARALQKLRGGESITEEFDHIAMTLAREPSGPQSWRLLFKKPLSPVLMLGVMLFCLQQLSGINVIIYFAPEIFKGLGFASATGQILATLGIGVVNVLVTIVALMAVDSIGRRKLLLVGFSGACLSLGALALFSLYQVPGLPYISVVCLVMYIFSFAISIGPVPHIAMSEIFPLHVRGAGMGLSAMTNWGFNTLVVFSFPLMQSSFGIEYTFAFYAVICFFGLLYTYFWMPETKNISLETIEDYLISGRPLAYLGRKLPHHSTADTLEDSDVVLDL